MIEKTHTKIFRNKNNNFDVKIDFLLNLSLENVVVVFYIEQMDRLFLQNLEDEEIICEDMYFGAVKIEKAEDIKKTSKTHPNGRYAMNLDKSIKEATMKLYNSSLGAIYYGIYPNIITNIIDFAF